MPLYKQQTSLQGRGHAPSVNYYAGIKAPVPAAPSLPKGEYKFNIDLQSIGDAMFQASRYRKETELGLAKLEAAKQEQDQIAAEKQLKIDMSNALAQEISDVTDQLNQGFINNLTAARKQKTIKDKYRQYGILNASEIYNTANAEDGGASTFLKKRREQYGSFEMEENNKVLSKMWTDIPSSRNLPNAETIAMHYKIEQAGARAAAAVVNNNNNSGTQELSTLNKQILMEDGLDAAVYQATTTLSNIATTSPSMSPSQQVQNAYENTFQYFKSLGSSDEVAMAAANSAMRRIKPYTDLIQNGSKEEKEFYQNKANTAKAQRALMMGQMFPAQLLASEYDKIDFSNWGVEYDGMGKIIAPDIGVSTVNQYAPTSDGFVSQAVPTAITFPNGQTLPYTPETQWAVANQDKMLLAVVSGKVPVGEYIGRPAAVSVTNMASSQNVNARGPVPRGQENIIAQNSERFNRSINTATAQNNLKRQGEYDNVDYLGIIKSQDTSKASTVWSSDPEHWNQVYFEHGRPVQDSNILFNYLRVAPDGSLMMTPTSGVINTFADVMAGRDFKNHINAINTETNGLDPQTRAAMSRRLVNKGNQGVLDANPDTDIQLTDKATLKESIGGATLDVWEYINKNLVNKTIVPAEERIANWMQQEWFEPALKWYEDKAYNLIKAYDDWRTDNKLEDNWRNRGLFLKGASAEFVGSFAENADNIFNELNQTPSQAGLEGLLPQQDKGRKVEAGTIDINSYEDLPVKFNEDGSFSNFKYATIGADGWTYIVPTINMSAEEALKANKYVARFEGEDERAVNMAEQFGKRIREYLINRDQPVVEQQNETNAFSFQQPAFTQPIDESFRNTTVNWRNLAKAVRIVKAKDKQQEIQQEQTLVHSLRGVTDTFKDEFLKASEEASNTLLPVGKALAFYEIADQSGWVDAQRMLEETDSSLANYFTVNLAYGTGKSIEKSSDLITATAIYLFGPTDIKPVKFVQDLLKKDKAKLLDTGVDFIQTISKAPDELREEIRTQLLKAKESIESIGNDKSYSDLYTGNDFWDLVRNGDYHLARNK